MNGERRKRCCELTGCLALAHGLVGVAAVAVLVDSVVDAAHAAVKHWRAEDLGDDVVLGGEEVLVTGERAHERDKGLSGREGTYFSGDDHSQDEIPGRHTVGGLAELMATARLRQKRGCLVRVQVMVAIAFREIERSKAGDPKLVTGPRLGDD